MSESRQTRREFLARTGGVVAGSVITSQMTGCAATPAAKPSAGPPAEAEPKPRNYNPQMGYRTLGKTGIRISEIGLGGHSGGDVENRAAVLGRAAELGINYLDTNIVEECALYGEALRGRRDRWNIGFASWPEKLTPDGEKDLSIDGMTRSIEARLQAYKTDVLDLWRPVGATWGPGQDRVDTLWEINPRVLDMVVEVYERVRKQGKVRWLGISAHNAKVFRRVLNDYPQFSVVLFPCLFLSDEMKGNELTALAAKKNVGVIGIKPFGAGMIFGIKPSDVSGEVDPNAAAVLKKVLTDPHVSCVIPGVQRPEQLEVNVRASYERRAGISPQERQWLAHYEAMFHRHMVPEYEWLRGWVHV